MTGPRIGWLAALSTRRQGRRLIAESHAFLSGGLASERCRHGALPEDWEWVNFLAHGSAADLERLARGPFGAGPITRQVEWCAALVYLSRQLLASCAEQGLRLEDVQRLLLVPLEEELAATGRPGPGLPRPLVEQVVARLRVQPGLLDE